MGLSELRPWHTMPRMAWDSSWGMGQGAFPNKEGEPICTQWTPGEGNPVGVFWDVWQEPSLLVTLRAPTLALQTF